MTFSGIMFAELNKDLTMLKLWRERLLSADNDKDAEYYRALVLASRYRAESKEELIQSLGYTVIFNDERNECIALYPSKSAVYYDDEEDF